MMFFLADAETIIQPFESAELGRKYTENMQEHDPKSLGLVYFILKFTIVYTHFIWQMPV